MNIAAFIAAARNIARTADNGEILAFEEIYVDACVALEANVASRFDVVDVEHRTFTPAKYTLSLPVTLTCPLSLTCTVMACC